MPRRCSRIASRGLGKQEQPRTQIRVEIPPHAPGLSEQLLASPGRLCHVSTPTLTRLRALECAGVCPRWAQIWAQTQPRRHRRAATQRRVLGSRPVRQWRPPRGAAPWGPYWKASVGVLVPPPSRHVESGGPRSDTIPRGGVAGMEAALVFHRLQFAFTLVYHYLFPQLTMGLALLIVIMKALGLREGGERWNDAARFWIRIFA